MKVPVTKLHTDLQRFGASSIGASRTCNAFVYHALTLPNNEVDLSLLAKLGRKRLKKLRGLGNKGLDQLEHILAERGLTWANDNVDDNINIHLEGAYLVIRLKMTPHVHEEIANVIKLLNL